MREMPPGLGHLLLEGAAISFLRQLIQKAPVTRGTPAPCRGPSMCPRCRGGTESSEPPFKQVLALGALGGVAPRPEFWSISCRTSYPAPLASGSFWQDVPIFEVPPLRPRMVWGWRCRGRELSTRPGLWAEPLRGFPHRPQARPGQDFVMQQTGQPGLLSPPPLLPHPGGGGSPGRGPAPLCPLLPGQAVLRRGQPCRPARSPSGKEGGPRRWGPGAEEGAVARWPSGPQARGEEDKHVGCGLRWSGWAPGGCACCRAISGKRRRDP